MFRFPATAARGWVAWVLVCLLLTATACTLLGEDIDCRDSRFNSLRVTLPPSAAALQETCSSFNSNTYEAGFTMKSQDLAAFQAGTRIQNWQTSIGNNTIFKDQAARAQSVLYGTFNDAAIVQYVLIDTSDPQQYKVYYRSLNVE